MITSSRDKQQPPTTRLLPGPLKRLREHLREIRRVVGETHALLSEVQETSTSLRAQLQDLASGQSDLGARLDALAAEQKAASSVATTHHQQLVEILRFVNERAQWRRQSLRKVRSDPSYERAFSETQPLISVVIPTYDQYPMLRERSIPSVLAQTYQNFEIVVVGDAAPDEARAVVEAFEDSRISFSNLPYRGPYPDDPATGWLVWGVPAYNEAARQARGLWIAPLDDDDALRPHHLERLLERARGGRLEMAYGRQRVHFVDGAEMTVGCFPPEHGQFGVQAALYHSHLRNVFEWELADAALGLPSDWALCLRMMEAGVRIGMVDDVTVDYYPSRSWTPRWEGDRFGPWLDQDPEASAGVAGDPQEEQVLGPG